MRCWICGENHCNEMCLDFVAYYSHPESYCVWAAREGEEATDSDYAQGVEEVTWGEFQKLKTQGWSDGTIPF